MKAKHIINIAGTRCPPAGDQEFNRWYDEIHIPVNMKFGGLIGVTRYKLARFTDYATVKDYPQYFTTYEFKDLATWQAWNSSPELAEASEGVPDLFARLSVELLWRVQYECMGTWRNTPTFSVVTIVGTTCPPETEEKFDKWYSEKHIPDLLKFKGLEGAARFKLAGSQFLAVKLSGTVERKATEYPKFLTFYYFKDKKTADAYDTSPERDATLNEWHDIVKETGLSVPWRAQYEPMRTWQR